MFNMPIAISCGSPSSRRCQRKSYHLLAKLETVSSEPYIQAGHVGNTARVPANIWLDREIIERPGSGIIHMANRRIGTRGVILVLITIVAGTALAWRFWPRSQVQIERADSPAREESKSIANVTTFMASAAVDDLCWNSDATLLGVLTKDDRGKGNAVRAVRTVLALDIPTEHRAVLHTTDAVLIGLAYSPDGKFMASASWRTSPTGECEILFWDMATRSRAKSLIGAPLGGMSVPITSDPLAIAISPDGKYLAAGTKVVDAGLLQGAHIGGEVCVWDLDTNQLKWFNRTTHTDIVQSVAFSGDSKLMVTAGIDKLIRLWDAESGKLTATLSGAAWHGVHSVAITPDGKRVASGGSGEEDGGSVRVWDVTTGKLLQRFSAFRQRSNVRVAFTPDGLTLVATGVAKDSDHSEFVVHAWDASTGRHIGRLANHAGTPRSMAISRDGMKVAIGTFEGHIVLVDVQDESWGR